MCWAGENQLHMCVVCACPEVCCTAPWKGTAASRLVQHKADNNTSVQQQTAYCSPLVCVCVGVGPSYSQAVEECAAVGWHQHHVQLRYAGGTEGLLTTTGYKTPSLCQLVPVWSG